MVGTTNVAETSVSDSVKIVETTNIKINKISIENGTTPKEAANALPKDVGQLSPEARNWFLSLISGQDALSYIRSQMFAVQKDMAQGKITEAQSKNILNKLNILYEFSAKKAQHLDSQLEKIIKDPKVSKEKKALALLFKEQIKQLQLEELQEQEVKNSAEGKTDPQFEKTKELIIKDQEAYKKARDKLGPEGERSIEQFTDFVKKFVKVAGLEEIGDQDIIKNPLTVLRRVLIEKAGLPKEEMEKFTDQLVKSEIIDAQDQKQLKEMLSLSRVIRDEKISTIEKRALTFAGGASLLMILMAYLASKKVNEGGGGGGGMH